MTTQLLNAQGRASVQNFLETWEKYPGTLATKAFFIKAEVAFNDPRRGEFPAYLSIPESETRGGLEQFLKLYPDMFSVAQAEFA